MMVKMHCAQISISLQVRNDLLAMVTRREKLLRKTSKTHFHKQNITRGEISAGGVGHQEKFHKISIGI